MFLFLSFLFFLPDKNKGEEELFSKMKFLSEGE